ncbi:alpha-glucuronidase family glycosyl hydrolase [Rossellomorea aquimaris]|uniref:alpha-glucuronidase family glycosyl hydrolase n=1 Tax=Rossellomorea aquimaris TaxID=189382 RepID=UPI001CFE98B8|nr:alpha-glucuronidase family glycosyl hydrolase [Rossellomorea aquimaris]
MAQLIVKKAEVPVPLVPPGSNIIPLQPSPIKDILTTLPKRYLIYKEECQGTCPPGTDKELFPIKTITYNSNHITMRFAVEELRRLYRNSGVELKVQKTNQDRNQHSDTIFIMLEEKYQSSPYYQSPLSLKKEGFAIIEQGSNIYIVGKEERSVLYGVYHLCEKKLGYSWVHLNEHKGIHQDKASACIQHPQFSRRGNIIETIDDPIYINRLIDWGAKNGLNEFFFTFFLWNKVKKYIENDLVKRSMHVTLGGHSLSFLLDNNKNQATHFLKDPNSQETVIKRIHEICSTSPVVTRVSLWPEDVGIQQDDYAAFMPAYIRFTEKLKSSLKDLQVEVEHIVYNAGLEWNMLERNEDTEASGKVDVLYAYWGRNYSNSIHSGREEQSRATDSLLDWRKETAAKQRAFTVLEYYSDHFMLSELFPPLFQRIKQDIEDYQKQGVDGVLNLIVPCHVKLYSSDIPKEYPWKWVQHFNNYMYAGSSWGKDYEELVDSYFSPLEEKKDFYRILMLDIEKILSPHTFWNVPLFPARVVDPEKVIGVGERDNIIDYLNGVIDFLEKRTPAISQEIMDLQTKDNYASFTQEEMLLIYFDYVKKAVRKCKQEWQGVQTHGLQ